MNKAKTVTIGICAYNEEKNIQKLLDSLFTQTQSMWTLSEIIVACDGCTDRTIEILESFKSKNLVLLISKTRQGKATNEQKIFDRFNSDYLVMLDADVTPKDSNLISNLVSNFLKNSKISLLGGNPRPFAPHTFIEKAVYTTFLVLDKSRAFVKDGNNIYGCSGQCLAMTKRFAKTITFPQGIIAEDDYLYFSCIANNHLFKYCKSAVVFYKLPKSLNDYFRQVFRADPDAAIRNVKKYFGNLPAKEYFRAPLQYANAIIAVFIQNPLGSLLMIGVRMISKIAGPFISKHYSLTWFTASSTK